MPLKDNFFHDPLLHYLIKPKIISYLQSSNYVETIFDSHMMRSIICESMPPDKVAIVNQHALRATTQFACGRFPVKFSEKNSRPEVCSIRGWIYITELFIEFSLSTTVLCNFHFVDLRPEDSGSFISGKQRKSCSVSLA